MLHTDDSPHRIALGVAIGTFIGFTPTVGFQTIIAIAVAAALRANKLAAVPMVWITNVVTAVPIYALCYRIGVGLVGGSVAAAPPIGAEHVIGPLEQIRAYGVSRMLELQFWTDLAAGLTRVGIELWAGCLLVGFICGVIAYFASRWAITAYRQRRAARREARGLRRSVRRFTKDLHAQRPVA